MKIDKLRVSCKCGEVFDAEIVTDAPLGVAIASMRAVRCPKCLNTDRIFLGGSYKDAPSLSTSIDVRADWWERRGERGTSSNTIYAAFTGYVPGRVSVPLDPDDFRRCRQLLDLIPEWRSNLSRVSERYPFFAPMIERWDEMDALYDQEKSSGKCALLYDLMRQLRTPAPAASTGTRAAPARSDRRPKSGTAQ